LLDPDHDKTPISMFEYSRVFIHRLLFDIQFRD
jgi:hypothetical protein